MNHNNHNFSPALCTRVAYFTFEKFQLADVKQGSALKQITSLPRCEARIRSIAR